MASMFDSAMFSPQSYNGAGGLLGNILKMIQANPAASQGFDQSNATMQPQVGPTMAQGNQGQMGGVPFPIMGQQAQQQPDPSQLPAASQPTQGVMPQQPQGLGPLLGGQPSGGGLFGGIQSKLRDMAGVLNPQIGQLNMQKQALNASYQALVASGVDDATARAAALNPEIMKTIAGAKFDTKPTFGVIGQNQLGVNQYGFIQPNQRTVTPATTAGGTPVSGGQQGGIDPSLTGEDFLKAVAADPSLGPGKANMVKAIAEGRQPYPSGFLLKTPFGQWLTTAVGQYKPDLTAQDYNTMMATRKNYTSGPSFQEIKAINTAIGHAAKLYDASSKMGGSDTMPGWVNPVIQGAKNNFPSFDPGFQDAKKNYDALSETLATEVSKALNGGVPHVADKEHWRAIFSNADGPTQRTAAIKSAMSILEGRMTPLQQGYDQGMKGAGEPLQIINPENQQTFERLLLGKDPRGKDKASTAAAPDRGALEAEMRRRGLLK